MNEILTKQTWKVIITCFKRKSFIPFYYLGADWGFSKDNMKGIDYCWVEETHSVN